MNKLIVVLLAVCVVCIGCGKKGAEKLTEKMIEKSLEKDGVKADVKISGGNMTINTKDKDGKTTDIKVSEDKVAINSADGAITYAAGGSAKIPDTFPKDVYIYSGASVLSTMTVPGGQNVQLQTKDSRDKVIGAYKSKMTAEGWKEEVSMNTADQSMGSYKKDNKTVNVIVMTDNGKTVINLSIAEEK